jgi:non-ribosomal peptide synthetase component E (peptide arylation enzyme)
MILADPRGPPTGARIGGRATIDELLSRAAARRPDAVALLDAPNREAISDGQPRRLSYRQTDRMVSAIAGRLRRLGLHTDAIVALQMATPWKTC